MAELDAKVKQRAQNAIAALNRKTPVRAAYIFGSQAAGTADQWSDIDIAAFVEGLNDWTLRRRASLMAEMQEELGEDIEVHFFPAEDLASPAPNSFVAQLKQRGIPIVISGKKPPKKRAPKNK